MENKKNVYIPQEDVPTSQKETILLTSETQIEVSPNTLKKSVKIVGESGDGEDENIDLEETQIVWSTGTQLDVDSQIPGLTVGPLDSGDFTRKRAAKRKCSVLYSKLDDDVLNSSKIDQIKAGELSTTDDATIYKFDKMADGRVTKIQKRSRTAASYRKSKWTSSSSEESEPGTKVHRSKKRQRKDLRLKFDRLRLGVDNHLGLGPGKSYLTNKETDSVRSHKSSEKYFTISSNQLSEEEESVRLIDNNFNESSARGILRLNEPNSRDKAVDLQTLHSTTPVVPCLDRQLDHINQIQYNGMNSDSIEEMAVDG